jgi:hypothetical protein
MKSFVHRSARGRYYLHDLLRLYGEELLRADGSQWTKQHDPESADRLAALARLDLHGGGVHQMRPPALL